VNSVGRMIGIAIIGVIATVLAIVAGRAESDAFDPYFGPVPPWTAVVGVSLLALPVLRGLGDRGWDLWGGDRSEWLLIVAAALALAAMAIVADLLLRYPEDMNVPAPASLAFYPTIAWVVEVTFHATPLLGLIVVFGSPDSTADIRFWAMAAAVAAIEAGLQAAYATTLGTAVFSGVHLLVIGIVQVYVFRRVGFFPMLGFRLVYYAVWHLAWGAARLQLLW
jgi:hypothetical protein